MTIFNGFTHDIPPGGVANQVLTKTSDKDYDTKWSNLPLANNIYSTEETVIGTWIDGKPIYQKTFVVDQATNGYNNLTSDIPIEQLIYSEIQFTNPSGRQYIPYNACSTEFIDGLLRVWFGSSSELISGIAYVTVKYTKITD